jgi:hypothetical protein
MLLIAVLLYILVMSGVLPYDGKCDICNKQNPKKSIPVVHDRGNGAHRTYYWCFDCLRKELK